MNHRPNGPTPPSCSTAARTRHFALPLSCVASLLLASCGGSDSDNTIPPQPPAALQVPANISFDWVRKAPDLDLVAMRWDATPGATRYELFVDPDGPGPLPEAQADATIAFQYAPDGQAFSARFRPRELGAAYRLRACEAERCSDFSAAQVQDLASYYLHAFPSGPARYEFTSLESSAGISADGLIFVVGSSSEDVTVYSRASAQQAWQPRDVIAGVRGFPVLSADGGTLAVALGGWQSSPAGDLNVYQRASDGGWHLQATIDSSAVAAICGPSCKVGGSSVKLSSDGNILAVAVTTGTEQQISGGILVYTRQGTNWTNTAYLTPGAREVGSIMALSGDGRTLAVNAGIAHMNAWADLPQLRVYAQSDDGTWTPQAAFPVQLKWDLWFAGLSKSTLSLSHDGDTLAVNTQHWPDPLLPADYAIGVADLTCGDPAIWNPESPPGSYATSGPGWHVALYARQGKQWSREAIMVGWPSVDPVSALSNDGNALYYNGQLYDRGASGWGCPATQS